MQRKLCFYAEQVSRNFHCGKMSMLQDVRDAVHRLAEQIPCDVRPHCALRWEISEAVTNVEVEQFHE